jgi:hypothetical protein
MQIFYAGDNMTKGKLKVVTDEKDYRGYQEMPAFGANVPLPILEEDDEPAYVRRDHNEALIVGPMKIVRLLLTM